MDRGFDALLRGYELEPRPRAAASPGDARGVRRRAGRRRSQMYSVVPKGFIPDQDNDSMFVNLRAAQGTSYYEMSRWTQQVADIVIKNPNIDTFMANTGGGVGQRTRAHAACSCCRARQRAGDRRSRSRRSIRPLLLSSPAFRAFVGAAAGAADRRPHGQQNYSLMVQSANTDELYAGRRSSKRRCRRCRRCRTSRTTWR